ncbi:hypothetical protein EYZ11_010842 [Aspergillus tanneri]|uniref:Uncharacterized protein n=1 Tax=Aspergillus tanneri TaxID=1220188 RepID=A0A4S3J4D8_9EURO|nr:hypothetical protein EYZ11_010842 [Aspergillus tanneri]
MWHDIREDAVNTLLEGTGKLELTGRGTPWTRSEWKNESFKGESDGAPFPGIGLVTQSLQTDFVEYISDWDNLFFLHTPHSWTGDAWRKKLARWKWIMDSRREV